jgi:two-component system phosphate regulon sensor histidine kinase PhoR
MRFVIQTLVENAINYSKDNCSIIVNVEKKDNMIIISVKDSGIGIAKEELPRMFTKFYRGKEARSTDTEGMGIGLYMTHDIVTRHHGKIWVESEGPGKGSTFSISLPVAE